MRTNTNRFLLQLKKQLLDRLPQAYNRFQIYRGMYQEIVARTSRADMYFEIISSSIYKGLNSISLQWWRNYI
jgi:hypothetical protein